MVPASTSFTPLEQRVLRLAATGSEHPNSIVEGPLRRLSRRVGNIVMARRGGRELADPRLEALRSYAAGVRAGTSAGLPLLYAAGYSSRDAEAVKSFISHEESAAHYRPSRSDRLIYIGGITLGITSIISFVAMTGSLLSHI